VTTQAGTGYFADRFAGRRALVTGGGGGIGRATAMRLAREGARVALVDIDLAAAESVAAEIAQPGHALAFGADCADEEQISAAVDQAARSFDGLDIILANAGIELLAQDSPVDQLELAVWRRLISNNLDGQFLTCKHGIRHLLAAGGGAVVCLGSNVATLGIARGEPAYSASKGGIHAMMRVMATDYIDQNIRVNMVVPGLVDTPMNAPLAQDPQELAYWTGQLPIKRAGTAEECAAAILWLASDEASYCVGTMLVVDGGQSAI
jgi:NAD(P)-dependent dehydrogenase (short-subunit alcohol dehydrogenase family)